MHKASWTLLAALLACGDGTIGSEVCAGTVCETVGFQVEALNVPFKEVPTASPSPLPAFTWTLPNPCPDCGEEERAQLFWAGGDRTWNVVRGRAVPVVELIDAQGVRGPPQSLELPTGASSLLGAHAAGQSEGTLLMHAIWSQRAGNPLIEEMVRFSELPVERSTLRPLVQTMRQMGAIAGGAGDWLLFEHDLAAGMQATTLRLLDATGEQLWLHGKLPKDVPLVGGSAVWTTSQFVLAARNEAPLYHLMWFAPTGELQRGTRILSANWRSAQLLDRGQGQFVAVAQSDLEAGAASGGANEGNIDVVVFNYGDPRIGWRLRRECIYKLEVYGFAQAQPSGVMFVSSMVGTFEEPRGLLCRLPGDGGGVARCFQTAPQQRLGSLVAIGPSAVVAELNGDQIVRIDLP